MPSHFGISKKLPRLFLYALLTGVSLALVYGYFELARYAEPFPVEWAGEADSVWLRFDKNNPYSGRIIFVSHTAFGQQMVDEYQRLFELGIPGLQRESHAAYSAVAADQSSLHAQPYLDFLVLAKLKARRLQRFLFSTRVLSDPAPAGRYTAAHLQPLFTRGLYNKPDNTLVDQLRFLVQKAERGSTIRISVFLFFYDNDNEPLLIDLIGAVERGVNVQLLTDLPEADNPEKRGIGYVFQSRFARRIQDAAVRGNSDSWLKNHSRVSWDSKNHTKIFLFSDSAGFKNWVIITSENLTDTERQKYQAGLLIRDEASYNAFSKYWDQILTGSYTNLWAASNGKDLTHYFFPQTDGDDEIYRQLDHISRAPGQASLAKLSISMARWNFERFPLAMKLVQLAEQGVKIEIITRNNPKIVDEIILALLSHRANITLHTADVDRLNIHSKYVLYEGYYQENISTGPEKPKKILWVGSHNFTGIAVRNNYETWSEVRDEKIFQDFSDNFAELRSLVPVDPNSGNFN